jgi:zinc protease
MQTAALAACLTTASIAGAQGLSVERTPGSVASVASLTDTITSSFEVSGVKVILRRVTNNDVIAANLYLLGGVRQVQPGKAGLELLLLNASERGTRGYSKDQLRARMARLGTSIGASADHDWTMFGLRATSATFDSTWAIFADRLMRPRLDSAEVEFVRSQVLSSLAQTSDSPDDRLSELADSVVFAGHPYAVPPEGTHASVSSITLSDLREFHRTQMTTSRMLLVVVGNVSRSHVERLVGNSLGRLPAGNYRWTLPDTIPQRAPLLFVEKRGLPTNYILGYWVGPPASSADAPALRVASAVLSGRLFSEIRSRRNLTYAVNAPFLDRALVAGGLYVTTVDPERVLAIMREELRHLRDDPLDPVGLDRLVQQFITEYFLDNETNAAQADFLARAELYQGDWKRAAGFVDALRSVTPEDVQRVARRYMRGIRFAYIGDPTKLRRETVERFPGPLTP